MTETQHLINQPSAWREPDAVQHCRRCPNDTRNPAVRITGSGMCELCDAYLSGYRREDLDRELDQLRDLIGSGRGHHDAMFGLSGGKDSTAALVRAIELGFTPLPFTFDTGYYPEHIVPRAAAAAAGLGLEHETIDLRERIRPADHRSFGMTADLYDEPETPELAHRFRRLYALGRERYSVRHGDPMPYVRTCQLCRRLVVPAYHREASRSGIRVIMLGTNEWVGLSQHPTAGRYRFSAIRALRPDPGAEPVYVVHLPFLLGAGLDDTRAVLDRIGWQPPATEALVESNANSCLLSRAAEAKATRLLGFHPDTTRLAREATVGFLTREQALTALADRHDYPLTVREVLHRAGILA